MNKYTSIIAADKIIRLGTYSSLLLIVVTFAYVGFFYHLLPPVLPLYNQMPWGEARLGDKIEVFFLPVIALFVLAVNSFLSSTLYERMPLISRALTVTAFLIVLITGIFIFRTVQLLV